jgi:hypothetical protein
MRFERRLVPFSGYEIYFFFTVAWTFHIQFLKEEVEGGGEGGDWGGEKVKFNTLLWTYRIEALDVSFHRVLLPWHFSFNSCGHTRTCSHLVPWIMNLLLVYSSVKGVGNLLVAHTHTQCRRVKTLLCPHYDTYGIKGNEMEDRKGPNWVFPSEKLTAELFNHYSVFLECKNCFFGVDKKFVRRHTHTPTHPHTSR